MSQWDVKLFLPPPVFLTIVLSSPDSELFGLHGQPGDGCLVFAYLLCQLGDVPVSLEVPRALDLAIVVGHLLDHLV